MLNKEFYLNLLKQKDFNSIIKQLKIDYILLLKKLLDKKNIQYENIDYLNYYILLCKKNYTELSSNLIIIKNLFTYGNVENIDKIDDLITIYSYILKKYNLY